jgi:hypothetical protein
LFGTWKRANACLNFPSSAVPKQAKGGMEARKGGASDHYFFGLIWNPSFLFYLTKTSKIEIKEGINSLRVTKGESEYLSGFKV